jgi:HSP20 family molecular chaperone IbpA
MYDLFRPRYKALREKDGGYRVLCEMPGVAATDVNVEVVNDSLQIAATRKADERKYVLDFAVDSDRLDTSTISASMENGLLTLVVPAKKPETRKIEVRSLLGA